MSIQKYAYLLDQDNYIVENKIFIDLIWHISKENLSINTKSYVIRNAGIMFQQIFYWHYHYLKNNKSTKYQYKGTNVIKMNFEDWWNSIRITQKEITTANKLLLDSGLIDIHKMRIKVKDKDIFKPCNCYELKIDILEKYMDKLLEINKSIYSEKITKIKEKNLKAHMKKREQSTDLSTVTPVIPETDATLNLKDSSEIIDNLSTLSTASDEVSSKRNENSGLVIPETGITKKIPETGITEVISKTGIANKSNTSFFNTSSTDSSNKELTLSDLSVERDFWYKICILIKGHLSDITFNTWIKEGIKSTTLKESTLELYVINSLSKEVLESKYSGLILKAARNLCTTIKNIKIVVV